METPISAQSFLDKVNTARAASIAAVIKTINTQINGVVPEQPSILGRGQFLEDSILIDVECYYDEKLVNSVLDQFREQGWEVYRDKKNQVRNRGREEGDVEVRVYSFSPKGK